MYLHVASRKVLHPIRGIIGSRLGLQKYQYCWQTILYPPWQTEYVFHLWPADIMHSYRIFRYVQSIRNFPSALTIVKKKLSLPFDHIWTKTFNPQIQHYSDVIMSAMASQITCVSSVCTTVCSGGDQRKHHGSASPAFVRGIHWWPVDSPPWQRASNAENVSIWWRHHGPKIYV